MYSYGTFKLKHVPSVNFSSFELVYLQDFIYELSLFSSEAFTIKINKGFLIKLSFEWGMQYALCSTILLNPTICQYWQTSTATA